MSFTDYPIPKQMGVLSLISRTFFIIFIILLFLNIGYTAIETRSVEPVIKQIGSIFLLSTNTLASESQAIVSRSGLYIATGNFGTDMLALFKSCSLLFVSLYSIYLWLKLLAKIYSWMPFSDASATFKNYMLAFFTFILLQSLLIIATNAINKEISCFSGCSGSFMSSLVKPFTAFIDLYRVIPYVLKVSNQYIKMPGNSTIS